jgi:hypothetical protein
MIEEAYWAVRRLNNCWTAQQAIDQAGALLCRQMLQHGERETRPDLPTICVRNCLPLNQISLS